MGDADPVAALTEKQRECLRMVLTHHSSKEIARELGIGVDAVDQRIKGAMRKLGVNSRLEAARLFEMAERGTPFSRTHPVSADRRAIALIRDGFSRRTGVMDRAAGQVARISRRTRFFLASVFVFAMLGWLGVLFPVNDMVRDWNNQFHRNQASGDITFVAIDARSIAALGRTPWRRDIFAQLLERLDQEGVKRIAIDLWFDRPGEPEQDRALARVLEKLGDGAIFIIGEESSEEGAMVPVLPRPEFGDRALLAHPYLGGRLWAMRSIPHRARVGRRSYSSVASHLTGLFNTFESEWNFELDISDRFYFDFPIDFSINPRTIPVISAIDVLQDKVKHGSLEGDSVIIGFDERSDASGTAAPGHGTFPHAYYHILGAETLLAGPPKEIVWPVTFLPAVLAAFVSLRMRRNSIAIMLPVASAGILVALLCHFDRQMVFLNIGDSVALLLTVASGSGWHAFRTMRRRGYGNVIPADRG